MGRFLSLRHHRMSNPVDSCSMLRGAGCEPDLNGRSHGIRNSRLIMDGRRAGRILMSNMTSEGTGAAGRRDRLIVVEDDPVTRSMIARYFAEQGFEVEEAGTGAECRRALKQRPADLIFIDIQLPDGDGFDL